MAPSRSWDIVNWHRTDDLDNTESELHARLTDNFMGLVEVLIDLGQEWLPALMALAFEAKREGVKANIRPYAEGLAAVALGDQDLVQTFIKTLRNEFERQGVSTQQALQSQLMTLFSPPQAVLAKLPLPKQNAHHWSAPWMNKGDTTHKHTCSECALVVETEPDVTPDVEAHGFDGHCERKDAHRWQAFEIREDGGANLHYHVCRFCPVVVTTRAGELPKPSRDNYPPMCFGPPDRFDDEYEDA